MINPPEIIYESDRRFAVVTYGVGHRGLVLRTVPEAGQHSRVEVWFKPAYAVCLAPWLEGIQIARGAADTSECRKAIGRPIFDGSGIKPGERDLFSITANDQ